MSRKTSYQRWYENNKEKARAYKAANMRKYRAENPKKYAEQSRNAKAKLRLAIIAAYGNKCVLCGFNDYRALTLDHILNNGAEERKMLGERGVYYRAIKEENKHEYRMLCMNCQFIERHKVGRQNQHGKLYQKE